MKVPSNIKWNEFLMLFYSRLDIGREWEIEIFDERGIEIVSIDDLVDNDVLVVREKGSHDPRGGPPLGHGQVHKNHPQNEHYRKSHDPALPTMTSNPIRSHDPAPPIIKSHSDINFTPNTRLREVGDHTPSSVMVGVPHLTHFIQSNSFGYYFLAESENMKMLTHHPRPGGPGGRVKKAHCIVKVPHIKGGCVYGWVWLK